MAYNTITGRSLEDEAAQRKYQLEGMGRVVNAYGHPIQGLQNLDLAIGQARRGEMPLDETVGLVTGLNLAAMQSPSGGGGVANIGRRAASRKLAQGYKDMIGPKRAPKGTGVRDLLEWEIEGYKKKAETATSLEKKEVFNGYTEYLEKLRKHPRSAEAHVREVTAIARKEQLLGVNRTSPALLDNIDDVVVGNRSDFRTPTTAGTFSSNNRRATISPIVPRQDVLAHEGGHGYLKEAVRYTGDKSNLQKRKLANWIEAPVRSLVDLDDDALRMQRYVELYKDLPSELFPNKAAEFTLDYAAKHNNKAPSREVFEQNAGRLMRETVRETVGKNREVASMAKEYTRGSKRYQPTFYAEGKPVNLPIQYMQVPQFKNTQDAVAFGATATRKQYKKLDAARTKALKSADEAKQAGDFQAWMDRATDAQFYREALEANKGTHPLQRKGK